VNTNKLQRNAETNQSYTTTFHDGVDRPMQEGTMFNKKPINCYWEAKLSLIQISKNDSKLITLHYGFTINMGQVSILLPSRYNN
jgi:hypothetical protein